jgi:ATP-binding cassette, subfamily C (CFTR/MRP), member 10
LSAQTSSFHQFWSLPVQIAIALYLLYGQLGLAFLAGLTFAILLIPLNRVLANKIGALSTAMMQQKDARVNVRVCSTFLASVPSE